MQTSPYFPSLADSGNDTPADSRMMLDDARSAVIAVQKNSKLRIHYLKLSVMNNIMRAFVYLYKLDEEYKAAQESLLATLVRVEARKNRAWLTSDKLALEYAYQKYVDLLESATDQQLNEILRFVDYNRSEGKWCVHASKNG